MRPMRTAHAFATALLSALLLTLQTAPAWGQDTGTPPPAEAAPAPGILDRWFPPKPEGLDAQERLQVTAPFVELHTGPGRGYPVFHVVEREGWITIVLRHTDWYKVSTEDGKLGWVNREQLASTLTASGDRKTFREVVLDDYLRRRVEMGATFGRFDSEPVIKLWGGYRLSDTLSVELASSQVQGVYAGTSLWHVALLTEPWFKQRLSPFFGVGIGRFHNVPNKSLIDAHTTDANLGMVTLGLKYHLSERFVARLDYELTTAFLSDAKTSDYGAYSAGLSFFF